MSSKKRNVNVPIIFLDIDWVIVSPYNPETTDHKFNPELVEKLKEIIKATDAKIVISSSWKYRMDRLIAEWTKHWLEMFIDTTRHHYGRPHMKREEEISEWIQWNEVNNYIVIDDCHRLNLKKFWKLNKLVYTDTRKWLTDFDVDISISLLNK